MKALPWILTGLGIGIGAVVVHVLYHESEPAYARGYSSVEDAAHTTFDWGTKQRVTGKGESIVGKVKEGLGRVTGDSTLADDGATDSLIGDAKNAAGKLGHAVGETIHDLNK
jgi:uncharacterized protein YjbJ (UPF0337 family)